MTGPAVLVLGPVALAGDVPVAGLLPRRLLALLALAGTEGRSAAALADELWPEDPPRNPRAALQMLVSRVRAAAPDGAIRSTPAGYAATGTDLGHAAALLRSAGEDASSAAGLAADALALWRGDPGADLDDELGAVLGARAGTLRQNLLRVRAEALLAAGDPEAPEAAARLAALDPLASAPVGLLLRALAAADRTTEALAVFAEHRERLADTLGTDPDPDLVALHATLLRVPQGRTVVTGVRAGSDPLLGRDADIAALLTGVPGTRLTTILGPGGLGKTRLAHEVAGLLAPRFGRVAFVELVGTRTEEDVDAAIAEALGARSVRAGRRLGEVPDQRARTLDALAATRTLLVLDNCEHVVDAAATVVAELLAAAPDLVVLTTSRIPLLLPGERIHAPDPLDADTDAASLFTRRALAVRPDARLDPAGVRRIVRHLDGLPLAIELAAARLRTMTLAELEERLADRFAVLVGGARTAPERHRTLAAVIDWSWRLLTAGQQRTAAALAEFPDGFTSWGAARLLDRDADEDLAALVDQSLLRFEESPEGGRFRMLETVREFGLARGGAAAGALDRFGLAFHARWAPGLAGGAEPAAAGAVRREEETLRLLLRRPPEGRGPVVVATFALLTEWWTYRGDFEAVVAALPLLAPAVRDAGSPAHDRDALVQALTFGAAVAMFSTPVAAAGGRDVVIARRDRLLALLRRAIRRAPEARWAPIGGLLLEPGGPDRALDRLATLRGGDPLIAAFGAVLRAQLLENDGRIDEALAASEEAVAIGSRHGLTWVRLAGRISAAELHSQRGDAAEAVRLGFAAEREARALDPEVDTRQLDWVVAMGLLALGRIDEAEARFRTLAGSVATSEVEDTRAIAATGLAEVATARHDPDLARERWAAAVRAARDSSGPWRVLCAAAALAAAATRGEQDPALHRRVRGTAKALVRIAEATGFLDRAILASAALALAASLTERPGGEEIGRALAGAALAAGARADFPSLATVRRALAGAPAPSGDAVAAITALLRDPRTA